MDITILKQHLGDELFAQVTEKLGSVEGLTIISTGDGSWIPKARFQNELDKVKALNANIASLTTELDEAKKASGSIPSLNQQIEQLKNDVAERDGRITTMQRTGKMLEKIRTANARNPETVLRLIDMKKIGEDKDGNLTGFDEQLTSLKESDTYLFTADNGGKGGFGGGKDPNGGSNGGGASSNADVNASIRAAAGR